MDSMSLSAFQGAILRGLGMPVGLIFHLVGASQGYCLLCCVLHVYMAGRQGDRLMAPCRL